MKKISAKRVFAIIGIVMASVVGFVGAVVGVLAVMGKFKTPVVFPTVLEFEVTEEVIIEGKTFDVDLFNWTGEWKEQEATIYSFALVGENPNEEHDVNQKDCYLWFNDIASSSLITLCDRNGKPLTKDANNRYLVQCNEPIYYMVNKIDEDTQVGETDGKVTLSARSVNETLKLPSSPKVIWIDRVVDSVYVKDMGVISNVGTSREQDITVGVEIPFEFEYSVITPLSYKPIAKESAKEIELYYNVEGMEYVTDYVRVTKEEVEKPSSPLHSILTYDETNDVFVFKASTAIPNQHKFYLATFKTYEAKSKYESLIDGVFIEQPNYHRLTSVGSDGKPYMAVTTLTVTVKDTDISQVGLEGSNIVLDLYKTNNIYLNNDAQDNNLGLYMLRGDYGNMVEDTSRFDEVDFNNVSDRINDNKIPEFTNDDLEELEVNSNTRYVYTNIMVGTNIYLVDYAYDALNPNVEYYCSNGVAVVDTHGTSQTADDDIFMIDTGSYLNFYIKRESKSNSKIDYRPANITFDSVKVGSGTERYWNILSKSIPELIDDQNYIESLVVGILVVNNKGSFEWDNFFRTLPVTLNPIALDVDYLNVVKDFEITFEDANKIIYQEFGFEEFIQINAGSYNACVLVAPVTDNNGNPITQIVDTVDGVIFSVGGKDYVLVGYVDERSGKFVNAVRVNSSVSNANQSCTLKMLQLKNEYGQTVNEIIDPALDGGLNISDQDRNSKIVDLHGQSITINAKYILNSDLLTYTYYDNYNPEDPDSGKTTKDGQYYKVYENTEAHKIVLRSSNEHMIAKIAEFYAVDNSFFNSEYDNVTFVSAVLTNENEKSVLVVEYHTSSCLSDDQTPIQLELINVGADVALGNLKVLSGSPDEIVFNHGRVDKESITLFGEGTTDSTVLGASSYLLIVVGYAGGEYTYEAKIVVNGTDEDAVPIIWTLEGGDQKTPELLELFNNITTNNETTGFQGKENKGQTLPVTYDSSNLKIFNPNLTEKLIEQGGTVKLTVRIGSTTGYLKVVVDTKAFSVKTQNNQTSFDYSVKDLNLSEIVDLEYGNSSPANLLELSEDNLVRISDVKCVEYGDGILESYYDSNNKKWLLRKVISVEDGEYEDVLEIIDDELVGYKFKKDNSHIDLIISFKVQTIAGDKTIEISFTSNISIEVNDCWTDDRVFYAGTKIQLLKGDHNTGTDEYTYEENAVFKIIKQAGDDSAISFIIRNASEPIDIEEDGDCDALYLTSDEHIGDITIEVYVDGTLAHTFVGFKVLPNIIAEKKDVELTSQTENGVGVLYTIKSFDSNIVYGSSEGNLYRTYYTDNTLQEVSQSKTEFFKYNHLEDVADYSNLEMLAQGQGDPYITGGNTLNIGQMIKLQDSVQNSENKTIRKINLLYKNYPVRQNDEFVINNTYIANVDLNNITFKVLKENDNFVSVRVAGSNAETEFVLIDMFDEGETLDIEVVNGKFVIKTIVNEIIKNVTLTLVFDNNNEENRQELRYTNNNITILPYAPEFRDGRIQAYSGSTYDLLNGIYNANNSGENNYLPNDENILKLQVTGICDETGLNLITQDLVENFVASGYIQGQTGSNCEVVLKEVYGDEINVQVKYEITYVDGKTYVYLVPMTIKNRQKLTLQYPESDMLFVSGTYSLVDDKYKKEALELSGLTEHPLDEVYTISNINYEAVAIYTNRSTVINLKSDEIKKVSRAIVENEQNAETSNNKSTDIKVELVLYQAQPGLLGYLQGRIGITNNYIELPSSPSVGLAGVLIFKLSTKSGNYAYYNIYIYCVGEYSSAKPSIQNNIEVIYHEHTLGFLNNSTGLKENSLVKTSENITDYITLVRALEYFESTFTISFDPQKTKVYLYEVIYTGETAGVVYDNSETPWKEVLSGQVIICDAHFKTITLGLILNNGIEQYCYGTITIYVQPTNEIDISATGSVKDFSYELPNGYFEANVEASATVIDCPFGADWSAEIVGVDGIPYNSEDPTNIYEVNDSSIRIKKRAENDVEIVVKYSKNGTIVFVKYIYAKTEIPEQTNAPTYIGEFKVDDAEPKFENKIDLDDSKYFGTYSATTANYKIEIGNDTLANNHYLVINGVKVSRSGTNLTFDQTHQQVEIQIKIIYSDYNSANNERIFKFIVYPGVHLDTRSSSEVSGLTNVRRATTTAKEDYESNVGSTLLIQKGTVGSATKYTIAGLVIYTNINSILELSFNEVAYVVNGNNIEVSGNMLIEFVHLAEEKALDMKIKVLDSATKTLQYAERTLYLKLVQTYGTLKATYLSDGANHENVQGYIYNQGTGAKDSVKIDNLDEKLFSSTYDGNANTVRFELLDANNQPIVTTVDLIAMGFGGDDNIGNPNYIKFTAPQNASIRSKAITFSVVTTRNIPCPVYLNNNAGLVENSVVYNYQIMAGPNVDGLNYDVTNGYYGTTESYENYISFALNDTDTSVGFESEKLIIGSMLDGENLGNFTIECSISGSSVSLTTINIADGLIGGNQTPVGEYENAIQYQFTNSGYTFYITYNFGNTDKTIELIVSRPSGVNIKDFEITFNAGGVNGGHTLVEDLTLVLSSNQIEEVYEDTYDTSVYSGYTVNLFEDNEDTDTLYNNGKFIENGGKTAPTLTYELDDSVYYVGGKELKISKGNNNNNLFKYDVAKRKLETLAVGDDVRAEINFLVKKGSYVIARITYKFYVYMNFKIVVNGESLADNINNSSPETYFVLTNEGEDFPLTKNFVGVQSIQDIRDHKDDSSEIVYYKTLMFDLYRIKVQNADDSSFVENTNVEVSLNSGNISGDVLTVTNSGIEFKKDFSGDIELLLTVKTIGNGIYQTIWTIHVSGLLTLEQITYEPIYKSSLPYHTGESVNLIKDGQDSDIAIKSSQLNRFSDKVDIGNNVEVKYNYRVIIADNETRPLNNSELYALRATQYDCGGSEDTVILDGTTANILLPSVPSTHGDISQTYFVVLEVSVEYKNQEQIFYIAYNVVNYQSVLDYTYQPDINDPSTAKYSADVTIDERVIERGDSYYLDLLHFNETLTKDDVDYKLIYTNKGNAETPQYKVVLNVEGAGQFVVNDGESTQANKIFTDGSVKYKYTVETRLLEKSVDNGVTYDQLGNTAKEGRYIDDLTNPVKYSVFAADFNNIFEFKNFIDQYLDQNEAEFAYANISQNVRELRLNQGVMINNNTCFTLVEIENGRFGIDLNQAPDYESYDNFADPNITLTVPYEEKLNFNNELRAEIAFVKNCVKVQTIQPYSATNAQGFRLISSNSIKANTNNGEGIKLSTMFLQSYFEAVDYYQTADKIVDKNKKYYYYFGGSGYLNIDPDADILSSCYEKAPTVEELKRLSVIGVGTPDASWVQNGNCDADSIRTVGEINIPGVDNPYLIKSVRYEFTGDSALGLDEFYAINQTHYYIDLNGNSGLYVPDYATVGLQTIFYEIAYAPNNDGKVVMDLTKAVKQWTMEEIATNKYVLASEYAEVESVDNIRYPFDLDSDDKTIYALSKHLIYTKLDNPDAMYSTANDVELNMPDGITLICMIKFALPEVIDLSVKYTAGSNDIFVKYTTPFANPEDKDLSGWDSIVDDYGYISYNAGKLLLNREMVQYYFANNPYENHFYVECKAINQNGYETILNIRVYK